MMKGNATFVLLLALASVGGCGQKGPLIRPGSHPAASPASAPPDTAAASSTPPAASAVQPAASAAP
jgi:predicted small lipoprotein YifL